MHIVRLKPGERVSDSADKVHINSFPDGKHGWSGSVVIGGSAVFGTGKSEFLSKEDAEAEALAWAEDRGAAEVMIETDHA